LGSLAHRLRRGPGPAAVGGPRGLECEAASRALVLGLGRAPGLGATSEAGCCADREGIGCLAGAPAVVDDVDHDDRHVVASATVDRQMHELVGRLAGIVHPTQHRGDAGFRNLVEQPVGAQQEAVTGHRLDGEDVDRHPVVDPERAGDDVALGMDRRLFGRQRAFAHQVGHQAVVVGELFELADRIAIDPRVADVGHRQHLVAVLVNNGQRHHRGAHAGEVGIAGGGLVDRLVGLLDGFDQAVDRVIGEAAADRLTGDRGRHVAAPMSAHAVGDGPEADVVAGHVVVVVRGTHAPHVGRASPAQRRATGHGGHRRPLTSAPAPCCRSAGGRGA
jgi:hypothetical protein